jgi:hypothetical protein
MIPEIINQWEENKWKLKEYFQTTEQPQYGSYRVIVEKLFELVIDGFLPEKITVIDDGDYQGTLIFLIPKDTYQPNSDDYIVTDTYYGSCSGCDTLQGISSYDDGLPTDEQVSEYMLLALHLVQKMRWLN